MRGDLVEQSAADACRDLAAASASGVLAIDGPDGPGRIVFAAGRVIAAVSPAPRARLGDRLVGAGELDPCALEEILASQETIGQNAQLGALLVERGLVRPEAVRRFVQEQVLDALFEIVRWRYGGFVFTLDDQVDTTGVPLSLAVDDALVEVSRRQHEWRELSRVIPDLEAVPRFRAGDATASASLEPDEFAVLASVDGERSIRGLASDLGYGEFEAARIIYGLSLLGIVDVRLPQDAIGAALEDALAGPDDEPHDENATEADPEPNDEPNDEPHHAPHDEPRDAERHDAEPAARPEKTLDLTFDVDATPTAGPLGPADRDRPADPADEPAARFPKPTPADERVPARIFADLYRDLDSAPRAKDAGSRPSATDERAGSRASGVAEVEDEATTGDRTTGEPATGVDADAGKHLGHESPSEPSRVPGPLPPPRRGDDNDVSEFLRELSRLSLDPPSRSRATPPPPPSDPPAPPPKPAGHQPTPTRSDAPRATPETSKAAAKRKRRGLFGRG